MKRDALQLIRSIYRANKHKNRAEHLEVFLDELELLKLEIRLCVDMKLLPIKKKMRLFNRIQIRRLAWIKTSVNCMQHFRSTENSGNRTDNAWNQNFASGGSSNQNNDNKNNTLGVRCSRGFK